MKKYRLKPRFYILTASAVILMGAAACMHVDNVCSKTINLGKTIEPVYAEVIQEVPEFESLGEYKITHYCSCSICCGEWGENRPTDENGDPIIRTASGAVAEAGKTIAVDPEVIPLGSTVYIDGQAYIAQDVGGAIKGNRIDVYCNSHEEALEKGVIYKSVYKEV